MANKRPPLKSPRTKSFKLQSGLCYYCNFPMWSNHPDEFGRLYGISEANLGYFQCTGEHLKPHSEGGAANQENIAAACAYCNSMRHRRKKVPSHERFRLYVQKRVQHGRWNAQRIKLL